MALGPAIQGEVLTQLWGVTASSALHLEPALWSTSAKGDRAYWNKYPGSVYFVHFHPGVDRSAPKGTPIMAMETGIVVASGWANDISGYHIVVEIRPGVRYGFGHTLSNLPKVGTHVARGQTIAYVGDTGVVTGPSTHSYLSIKEAGPDGIVRTFLYNMTLFEAGGRLQDDPRIKPLVSPPVALWKGRVTTTAPQPAGTPDKVCNIRSKANALASSIWARTYADGFTYQFINGVKGRKLWSNTSQYAWNGGYVGDYAQVKTGSGQILYIHKTILKVWVKP